jgi:hypothetical protein
MQVETQVAFTHSWPCAQAVHWRPLLPQAVAVVPALQNPAESQQPVGHSSGLHGVGPPPQALKRVTTRPKTLKKRTGA